MLTKNRHTVVTKNRHVVAKNKSMSGLMTLLYCFWCQILDVAVVGYKFKSESWWVTILRERESFVR